MMIHGYCDTCRKIKRVRVNLGRRPGRTPIGTCAQCEDALAERRSKFK